jgi:hypothetical protein
MLGAVIADYFVTDAAVAKPNDCITASCSAGRTFANF